MNVMNRLTGGDTPPLSTRRPLRRSRRSLARARSRWLTRRGNSYDTPGTLHGTPDCYCVHDARGTRKKYAKLGWKRGGRNDRFARDTLGVDWTKLTRLVANDCKGAPATSHRCANRDDMSIADSNVCSWRGI